MRKEMGSGMKKTVLQYENIEEYRDILPGMHDTTPLCQRLVYMQWIPPIPPARAV